MKRIITTLLLCAFLSAVFAQDDTTLPKPATEDTTAETPAIPAAKSYFLADLSFLSNSVYDGRKDSSATPYITPMIGYYNKSGFFIDGSLSYLPKSGSSRIDLVNIEAGYDFDIGNFDGEIAANKSFYNSSSTNVKSQVSGSVFFSGGYDFTYIKPMLMAGINFGTKPDYLLSFGLEHTFYAAKDKWQFSPAMMANGSTQNYYGSYFKKRKLGKRKNAGVIYDVTASVDDAARFKMLDYQFSLPILYICHKFSFSCTPAYVIPVNPAIVTTQLTPENGGNTITRVSAETISNSFYFSVGMSYKF
jgi:hypothetical protein